MGCIKFIKSVGKNIKLFRKGREYHGCGEEYNVEKREKKSNIIFRKILRLLERISSGER